MCKVTKVSKIGMYQVINRYSNLCRRNIYAFIQKNCLPSHKGNVNQSIVTCILDKGKTVGTKCGACLGQYGWLPVQYGIHTTSYRSAGHNRWSNIKHIKGRSDHKRSTLYMSHLRIITGVCKRTKETNPKFNAELARCLAAAKTAGVPTDALNKLMDRLNRTDLKPQTIEVEGPDGIAILLHCMVIGEHETSGIISPLKKKGYSVGRKVNIAHKFDHKGVITLPPRSEGEVNLDDYLEIGLEAGAEDVMLESDEEGKPFIQFLCQPGEMNIVIGKMEKLGLKEIQSQEVYSPIYPIVVTQEEADSIHSLFNGIMSKFDFIEDVTYNFEVESESD